MKDIRRSEPITCPHCGQVVEAARPSALKPDQRPKVDKAERHQFLAHQHGSFPCPKCRKEILIRWD